MLANPELMIGLVHMQIGDIKMRIVHTRPRILVGQELSVFVEISLLAMAEFSSPHFLHFFLDL